MVPHDSLDSCCEIRTRDAGHTRDRRLDVEFTRLENALGVSPRLAPKSKDLFIAGQLALVNESRTHPPHQRMKPKHSFHEHLNRRRKIVATTNMRHLVRDDRFDLTVSETVADASRPQQDRLDDPKYAGFERGARCDQCNRPPDS